MKLIIGLGNPGERYRKNRHNIGYLVVDKFVEGLRDGGYGLHQEWKKSSKGKLQYIWFDFEGERLEIIKPLTFMNNSGQSVLYAYKKHSLSSDDLYVIHDDLDIALGDYKIQKGKGPRLHGGVNSIEKSLGTDDFWRVRVGIENRQKVESRVSGEDYVLQNFTKEELAILEEVIAKVVGELFTKIG